MIKKILSVLLAVMMLVSVSVPIVSAQETQVASQEQTEVASALESLGTLLEKAVQIMNSPDIGAYPADACENLEKVMGEAYMVYYDTDSTLQELNTQINNLSNALADMKKSQVSEDAAYYLSNIISQAEMQVSDEINYTPDSYAVYSLALANAKRMQTEGKSDDEVIAAAEDLREAMACLEFVDSGIVSAREYLYSMIDLAYKTLYSGENYTQESVDMLTAEISIAEALYYSSDATSQQLYYEADKIMNTINIMEVVVISPEVISYLSGVIEMADFTVGAEEDYTRESWIAYQIAYSEAVRVLNMGESEQEYIDAANALGEAVNALVPVDRNIAVARENLWAVVNSANQILNSTERYTTESVKNLEAALESANAVGNKETATQQELVSETEKLQNAINSMEKIVISTEVRSALSQAIAKAETQVGAEESYTEESWISYQIAYYNALRVQSNGESDDEFVEATDNLNKVLSDLVLVDSGVAKARENLLSAVSSAHQILNSEEEYTQESITRLEGAIDSANAVASKEDATVEELDAETEKLKAVMNSMEKVGGSHAAEALESAIVSADEVDITQNYTPESLQEFLSALENAKAVLEGEASDEELTEATDRLLKALQNLTIIEDDNKVSPEAVEALEGAIASADEVDTTENYTPESLQEFLSALENAKAVLESRASDEALTEATDRLINAINNLEIACVYVLLGDVDGDGKVTIKDATFIQKSLAGITVLEGNSTYAADANRDGVINIKDATEIQKHLASLKACEDIGKEIQVLV